MIKLYYSLLDCRLKMIWLLKATDYTTFARLRTTYRSNAFVIFV